MSKSLFVKYRGHGFWAFDVITSVFLKQLADVAVTRLGEYPWLVETVYRWRVDTIVSDFGLELDDKWEGGQIEVVIGLIEEACRAIESRDEISAEEISNWELLDGQRIFVRGLSAVRTKAVANIGRGVVLLLRGSFPSPPEGMKWWYGVEDEPETIKRRGG